MGRMIGFVQSRASASNADEQSLAFASDVTAGSLLIVNIFESSGPSVPVITDTQGNTYAAAASGLTDQTTMYYAVAGASGPCTVTVNGSTDTFARFTMAEYSGDWGADPLDQSGVASGSTSPLATASITPANAAALMVAVAGRSTDTTWVGAGTDWTLGPVGLNRVVGAHRIVSVSASYAASFSWTGGSGTVTTVVASFIETAASGPTIDTQPVADTVLINGDAARASASFTVAATGTGTLSYQWELETSVGGGTYANVADGDGATWAGATATNLTATFTVKTLTGRRVRCVATDDNGSTTTNAVALTVYTGPVISKTSGTTNASGVDTLTCVSDYPNADGEFTVITATAGGVTKQVALHYETPP